MSEETIKWCAYVFAFILSVAILMEIGDRK